MTATPGSPPENSKGAAPTDQQDHTRRTRDAYDQLAPVWSQTTDDGPFNGLLERPALRRLVPHPIKGAVILDAGCGSGAQCEWLAQQGARPIGVDLSPAMIDQATRRCGTDTRFVVADLGEPLPADLGPVDGITCSLALHYLRDWEVPLRSFRSLLRPGGWIVLSLDHPFGPPLPGEHGDYFDTELVGATWRKANVEVTQHFWRRPLSETTDAFANAGFAVDRVVEPRPTAEAIARHPELIELVNTPSFIIYRLILVSKTPTAD